MNNTQLLIIPSYKYTDEKESVIIFNIYKKWKAAPSINNEERARMSCGCPFCWRSNRSLMVSMVSQLIGLGLYGNFHMLAVNYYVTTTPVFWNWGGWTPPHPHITLSAFLFYYIVGFNTSDFIIIIWAITLLAFTRDNPPQEHWILLHFISPTHFVCPGTWLYK